LAGCVRTVLGSESNSSRALVFNGEERLLCFISAFDERRTAL
jgi:hypothetical protein